MWKCPHWENTWILMHYSFAPQKAFWITKFLGITSLHKLGNRREWHFWFNLMSYTFFLCYCAFICKGEALKHGIGNYFKYISVNQYNTKFFFAYWFFFPKSLRENCFIRRLTKVKEIKYIISRNKFSYIPLETIEL